MVFKALAGAPSVPIAFFLKMTQHLNRLKLENNKLNANPKINILISDNIGQRRINVFSGILRCFILSSFLT